MSTRWTHTELDGTVVVIDDRSLADAQAEAVDRLRAAYERELARGMPWAGKTLQVDSAAITNMTATGTNLANNLPLPPGFAWRMLDNSSLPLDRAGFLAMAGAAFAHVAGLRARMWAAVDTARAAATREDADKVVF